LRIACWCLSEHFENEKTIVVVEYKFYWPNLKCEVAKYVGRFHIYQLAKQRKQNTDLYISLPVSNLSLARCEYEFRVRFTENFEKNDFVLVVVDRFSKIAHFLLYSRTIDTSKVAKIFFNSIVKLHDLHKTIVSDRDVKFISYL